MTMSWSWLFIALFVGLAVGLVGGVIITRYKSASQQAQRSLQQRVDELEQQQTEYKQAVTDHFAETAQLLAQMAANYRDIHYHLARGAQQLTGENADQLLAKLPENLLADVVVDAEPIAPPLDYAPKESEEEKGTLHETFGLDKNKS